MDLAVELTKELKGLLERLQQNLKVKEDEIFNKSGKNIHNELQLENRRIDVAAFEADVNFAVPISGDEPCVYQELLVDFTAKAYKINAEIDEIN